MTEDVDVFIFGAERVLREGGIGGGKPGLMDVVLYEGVLDKTGLDRDGMILCATLCGGDYFPGGLPLCGVKTGVEVPSPQSGVTLGNVVDGQGRVRNNFDDNE